MSSSNVTCPICDDCYDSSNRQPKLLPCSHSFCLNCLRSLVNRGSRLCPLCRENWHGLVDDLPMCYQLISEGNVQKSTRAMEICEEHNAEKALWCDSCQAVLCQKCIRRLHKECEWMLVTEKSASLRQSLVVAVQKLLEKEFDFKRIQKKNEVFSANITNFSLMLPNLQEAMKDYEKKLIAWKSEVDVEVKRSSSVSAELDVMKLQEKLHSLERLGKLPVPAQPTSLLLHIVNSFQATENGDPETFLVKFRKSVADLRSPGTTASADDEAEDGEEKTNEQIPEMKEGQTWVLTNRASIKAAGEVLTTTSVRPFAVCIQGGRWRGRCLQNFLAVLALVNCEVLVQAGDTFWTPGDNTIQTTRVRIEALVKPSHRCKLVEFWGHADEAIVQLLPKTVQRVGLAVRSSQDMKAVNTFGRVAFYDIVGYRILACLNEIHLSVTQGFQPSDWDLQWKWQYKDGRPWKQGLELLEAMKVSLALHLPRLGMQHLDWMMALVNTITKQCHYIGLVKKLYLPDCKLTPDTVLGVLRDLNMKSEVHLPGTLAPETARKDLGKRYWAYSCTIVWDMPTL